MTQANTQIIGPNAHPNRLAKASGKCDDSNRGIKRSVSYPYMRECIVNFGVRWTSDESDESSVVQLGPL